MLGDLKKVSRDPAHQLTGAVLIEKGERQGLHMGEKIPADICFDPGAQKMAPIGDDIGKDALADIGGGQHCHQSKESGEQALGQ